MQVKANSKKESVEKLDDGTFIVRVGTPPIEGRANKRVQELLAKYFKVAKSRVSLVSGPKSKRKVFEVT